MGRVTQPVRGARAQPRQQLGEEDHPDAIVRMEGRVSDRAVVAVVVAAGQARLEAERHAPAPVGDRRAGDASAGPDRRAAQVGLGPNPGGAPQQHQPLEPRLPGEGAAGQPALATSVHVDHADLEARAVVVPLVAKCAVDAEEGAPVAVEERGQRVEPDVTLDQLGVAVAIDDVEADRQIEVIGRAGGEGDALDQVAQALRAEAELVLATVGEDAVAPLADLVPDAQLADRRSPGGHRPARDEAAVRVDLVAGTAEHVGPDRAGVAGDGAGEEVTSQLEAQSADPGGGHQP